MKEIGGYIELEKNNGIMLYDDAIKLNCGRNALAYLIEAKKIRKISMPWYMCDSCKEILKQYKVEVNYYSVGMDFKPKDILLVENEWLYIVNYYGQFSNNDIKQYKEKYQRIIIDNAQAYFQPPVEGIDTIYTCRKFFGVADGAILYTDDLIDREFQQDESFERMHFLLGRFERSANEFYKEYVNNNDFFINEPIKRMSKLTENALCGLDYNIIKKKRTENFLLLYQEFEKINKLNLVISEGAFMYPLYVDNAELIRKELLKKRIYIPILWPNVLEMCSSDRLEYQMAKNILPLPVDQRYGMEDMEYLVKEVNTCIDNEGIEQ